eukprot:TRINITY_DN148_c0_g2_i2.p1 TRINITY_DN148_c0_g2~~TRINITY_DN148_c0_g2_i2.p1  ORF type:complete len:148 (+),score=30.09 TRINITY_DN148_c0_g2_i2:77-520(+)
MMMKSRGKMMTLLSMMMMMMMVMMMYIIQSHGVHGEDDAWEEHQKKVREALPDYGKPEIQKRLKCSACQSAAFEIMELFQARRNKSAPVQEWDYDDMMELACSEKMEPYGLQLRENKPTQVHTNTAKFGKKISGFPKNFRIFVADVF